MIGAPATLPAPAGLRRARAWRAQGRASEAIAELRDILGRDPDLAEAHHELGNALKSVGRYAEARSSLTEAARLDPGQAAIWLNLGVACLEIRLWDEAVAAFRSALALEPGRPEAHNVLGHTLLQQGRSTAAAEALATALRLRPGYPAAHDNLGRVRKAQGRSADAIAHHRAALAGTPRAATHSNLLYSLNLLPGISPAEMLAEHREWARLYAPEVRRIPGGPGRPAAGPSSRARLRVGYVSPDFINHAVAFFIEPVLAQHDRDRFEIFCYSDALAPDAVTRRLRSYPVQWRDIARASDEQVEALIRGDGIDLLVDLAGHTARHRLAVFAQRPAPVQISWLGYPNTTGLSAIDYRLTEAVSDPPGLTERWHTEKLVRLPETFSCYLPPRDAPPVGTLPAVAVGHLTFGCFNHLAKVTPATLDLWSRLLRQTPGARLFLKARGLADAPTAARIRDHFLRQGIAAERIELDGAELSTAEHLRLYQGVDIALDTFPYNGTTTTCEALWMGVPVVTLAGDAHVSRVGMPESIAHSPADYLARCRRLAQSLPLLSWLRQELRERMRASPICDAPRFTRNLEDAFRWMWAQQGDPAPAGGAPPARP